MQTSDERTRYFHEQMATMEIVRDDTIDLHIAERVTVVIQNPLTNKEAPPPAPFEPLLDSVK